MSVVAIAGSAGGLEALKRLLPGLPADLPATVLVGLHLLPTGDSLLAEILDRVCDLRVVAAEDGMVLEPGTVVVAQVDRHLLVPGGRVVLGDGPPEHGSRPCHDVMLRSVAAEFGPLAVGVVLTGMLHDGADGLAALARAGGTCLVQDPVGSDFPSMPESALAAVPGARVLGLLALAPAIVEAVTP